MNKSNVDGWESEMDFDLRYNRWLLKPLGLWIPIKNREKVIVKIGILSTSFILIIFIVPHGLYAILVETDPIMQLKFFGPISFCMMAIGKYLVVLNNKHGMEACMNFIAEDWKKFINKPEEKQFLMEAGRWCENFTKICIFFMYGGVISRAVFIPLIEYVYLTLSSPNATLMLHFPSYFGSRSYDVSTDIGFMFEILFFTHSVSIFYTSTIAVGMCTLMAKFVMHACSLIQIMIMHLELTIGNINEEKWNGTQHNEDLKFIVIAHLRILRFINYIEKTLTGVFFVEFTGSIFGICLLGYNIITSIEKKDIPQVITGTLILLAYVTNVFIYCYLGNRLTEQCQQVGTRVYQINWIRFIARKQGITGIQMIIMVSQHPPKLTAGKIIYLTMETFSSVLKVSATYLNMLRKFTTNI